MRAGAVIVVLLAAALAGCVGPLGPEDPIQHPALEDGPLWDGPWPPLRLEAPQTSWGPGENGTIWATFHNPFDHPIRFRGSLGCDHVHAKVLPNDRVDHEISVQYRDWSGACLAAVTTHAVEAGETINETLVWDGSLTSGHGPPYVPPGNYTIRATFAESTSRINVTIEEGTLNDPDLPRVRIEPRRRAWPAGNTTRIDVSLRNTANITFRYTSLDSCNEFLVHVLDTRGSNHHTSLDPISGSSGCEDGETEFTLEPGEVWHQVFAWDGSEDGEGGPPYVEPGDHTIEAILLGDPLWIPTNTTEIEITS